MAFAQQLPIRALLEHAHVLLQADARCPYSSCQICVLTGTHIVCHVIDASLLIKLYAKAMHSAMK